MDFTDELLQILFATAVELSGLPATGSPPPVEAMEYRAMLRVVCADLKPTAGREIAVLPARSSRTALPPEPQHSYEKCVSQRGLVAAYLPDQHRIVYRDELDLTNDADNSFIVHEFVHALQESRAGKDPFGNCNDAIAAERQAYAVQQRYLHSRGQLLRVGQVLRYVSCDGFY